MRQDEKPIAREIIQGMLRAKKDQTMLGIYERLRPWKDGVIRTKLSSTTRTGRLASKEDNWWPEHSTNLQNIPKKTAMLEELYKVRHVLVPRPGNVFVEADYSQVEARITAVYSKDYRVLEIFDSGDDIHRITASWIFEVDPEDVSAEQRFLGKVARHAFNYGLSAEGFYHIINSDSDLSGVTISLSQARMIYNKFHKVHPKLQQWWRKVQREVEESGYLTNPFGRRRTFLAPDPKPNEVIAHLPQSTAGDLLNTSLLDLYERYDPLLLRVVLQIHDAILVECRPERADEVSKVLRSTMERPIDVDGVELVVPVEVDVFEERWK